MVIDFGKSLKENLRDNGYGSRWTGRFQEYEFFRLEDGAVVFTTTKARAGWNWIINTVENARAVLQATGG